MGHHADPLGHAVGRLSFARPRLRDGCWLYVSDRGLAHALITLRGFAAITFGHVIISASEPSERLWQHERRHVAQYERLGLAFIPLYLWLLVRDGYAAHPLERDAAGAATLFDQ